MGYLIRPLRGHLPLKGKAGGCHFKAFPFRGRWLAEGQTDEAGGQRPPAGRRGRRPLRQNRKIPPSRRGGYPHPPASEDSSTRRGGTLGRPETARWGHRALQKIKRTFGYAVGAGPRPARRFWTYAGAHSVRPRAAEVVGPYGRTGRFPHLVGAGAPTRPPQRIPPTRRGGYQPPVSNRVPFTVGPVCDRPLRRSPDRFLHFRRGGTPGRPETARWGHRALHKIKRTFGYAVGAGPCGRPQFYCVHTGKVGNKHSLKHKNTGGPAGPPVFYFSFCSFIIATFRTISSR